MRVFGIDPGSERTGYGCVETDGRRHRMVTCGAIAAAAGDSFPRRLARIHQELSALLSRCRPEYVAVEDLFYSSNARSALKLGHARGVAILAAIEAGCEVVEYSPAEVKRAVVGYGRADKRQVQQMITLLLGLDAPPSPHDAADALAVAICHVHSGLGARDWGLGTGDSGLGTGDSGLGTGDSGLGTRDSGSGAGGSGLRTRATKTSLRSWRQYRPA